MTQDKRPACLTCGVWPGQDCRPGCPNDKARRDWADKQPDGPARKETRK